MTEFLLQYLAQSTAISLVAGGIVLLIAIVFRRRPGVVHLACVLALLAMLMPRLWFIPVPELGQAAFLADHSNKTHGMHLPRAWSGANDDRPGELHGTGTVHRPDLSSDPDIAGNGSRPERSAAGGEQANSADNTSTKDTGIGKTNPNNSIVNRAEFNKLAAAVPWPLILLTIWGIGSSALLTWYLHQINRFRRALRHARPVSRRLARTAKKCSSDAGLAQEPDLLEMDRTFSPLVYFAFSRPKLLMPVRLVTALSDAELESLVRHEMAHIKRRDHWVRWVEMVATTAFWFNPLLWVIRHKLRRAEELACDSMVAGLSVTGREAYASAFLKTIDFLSTSSSRGVGSVPVACTMGGFRFCKRRIEAIITGSHLATVSVSHRFVLAAATAPLFVLGMNFHSTPSLPDSSTESAPASPGDAGKPQDVDNSKTSSSPSTSASAPRVLDVFPADGAVNAACDTTIRIRFDQPMSFDKVILEWENDRENPTGCRLRGPVSYDAEKYEFSIPVFLEPGKKHRLAVNKNDFPESANHPFDEAGFTSEKGVAAEKFSWSFETTGPPTSTDSPTPKIVSVSPAPDSEVALFTTIRIKFDQPMDPDWFGFAPRTGYWRDDYRVSGDILYDRDTREFAIPLVLPPNWNGDVPLAGFRSVQGVVSEPQTLTYRTLRKPMSDEQIQAIEDAGKSAGLIRILEQIRQRYESIKSVKVEAFWHMTWGQLWSDEIEVRRSVFAREGEKYFGDVNVQMRSTKAFSSGSDGKQCWFRLNNELAVGPREQVDDINVSIASPFNGFAGRSIEEIVVEKKLEYLGVQAVGEKSFHVVRGWPSGVAEPVVWFFDVETMLLAKVRYHGEIVFAYQSINEPLPESLFAAPESDDLTIKEIEPLLEGYTEKFLRISDGSNGNMSLRWGQHGPKGTTSSGLN